VSQVLKEFRDHPVFQASQVLREFKDHPVFLA
jgi:hypothetical protein